MPVSRVPTLLAVLALSACHSDLIAGDDHRSTSSCLPGEPCGTDLGPATGPSGSADMGPESAPSRFPDMGPGWDPNATDFGGGWSSQGSDMSPRGGTGAVDFGWGNGWQPDLPFQPDLGPPPWEAVDLSGGWTVDQAVWSANNDLALQTPPPVRCLVQYNGAPLRRHDGTWTQPDECCYWQNGANVCDLLATCGPAAGGQCCLLYPGPGLSGGCCYYENNVNPPQDQFCASLLGVPASNGPDMSIPN